MKRHWKEEEEDEEKEEEGWRKSRGKLGKRPEGELFRRKKKEENGYLFM